MVASWAQAKTPKTVASLRTQFLAALVGTPLASWSPSAPQLRIVNDFCARLKEESDIRAALAQSLDVATLTVRDDDWTDVLLSWFDEVRIPALQAVWDVTFTAAATVAPVSITPTTVLQIQSSTGEIFEVDAAYHTSPTTISSATSYSGVVRLRAREAGTRGNVVSSSITGGKILTGPAGLSISAASLHTQGRDIETSEQAFVRALGKWARLGAGWTEEAFDYLIPTAAPSLTRWRVRTDNPFGPGTVGVVLAGASGPATTSERDAVFALLNARGVKPLGSGPLTVAAAIAQNVALTAQLASDGSNATLTTDARTAIITFLNALPLGPATVDDSIVRAILLGGDFASIPIVTGATTKTIAPDLAGFTGATSIVSLSYGAPLTVAADKVLVPTATVT